MRASRLFLLAALFSSPLLVACGGGENTASDDSSITDAKKHKCRSDSDCHTGQICKSGVCTTTAPPQCTSNAQCSNGQVCLAGGTCGACTSDSQCGAGLVCTAGQCGSSSGGGGGGGGPAVNPPPTSCDQRSAGVTAIQAVVTVTKYQGLQHGRNGTHEIVYGTISNTVWVYDQQIVDTKNVELAMNVKSSIDPTGLPQEIPLAPGQTFEVEGEYKPASSSNAGGFAILHYTHSPCGYVVLNGTKYQ